MPSTASDLLKFEKQADGENDSTWGAKTNTALSRLEEAIADITNIAVTTGDYTLDDTQYNEHDNGANSSESHVAAIKISGTLTGNRSVVVPSRNKIYWVWNINSGAYTTTVKTSGGSGVVVPQNTLMAVICDGTNVEALTPPVNTDGALILLEQSSAPSTGAGQGAIYTKDDTGSGQPEMFFREESDGDEVQLTKSGAVNRPLAQGNAYAGDSQGQAAAVDISTDGNALVGDGTDAVATGIIRQGIHTIGMLASGMTSQTTNGPASAQTEGSNSSYVSLDFDATTEEGAIFEVTMPKSWDAGTLTFRAKGTCTGTDTDGYTIGLQALACGDGDALDDSWGTAVVVRDEAQGTAGLELETPESSALTVGGSPNAGENVRFRVYRDVSDSNDDMGEDYKLRSIELFVNINAPEDT